MNNHYKQQEYVPMKSVLLFGKQGSHHFITFFLRETLKRIPSYFIKRAAKAGNMLQKTIRIDRYLRSLRGMLQNCYFLRSPTLGCSGGIHRYFLCSNGVQHPATNNNEIIFFIKYQINRSFSYCFSAFTRKIVYEKGGNS